MNRNMVNEIGSRMNVDTLHAQVFAQLLDDQSCLNTFAAINKAANVPVPSVMDNNSVFASALPVFTVGQRYVTNVTITSMRLTNFVNDLFPPFDARAQLNIVYTIPFGEGSDKDFTRTLLIRTRNPAYPGAWADGVPMAEGTVRCVASAPAGSLLLSGGLNLTTNISKRYSDTKSSDLNIVKNGAGPIGKLILNGNLIARGLFTLSDRNLKQDLVPLKMDFKKFSKIGAYRFQWKGTDVDGFGFKAQEVRKSFPELVSQNSSNQYYQVDYFGEIPLILEGIKAMEKENIQIEQDISRLEQKEREREASRQ